MESKPWLCPICADPLDEADEVPVCLGCHTPHHPDCFEFFGRCAVYGCGGLRMGSLPKQTFLPKLVSGQSLLEEVSISRQLGILRKRAQALSKSWPKTLPAALRGALLATAFQPVLVTLFSGRSYRLSQIFEMLLVVGPVFLVGALAAGLVAPFLSPWQHKRPWEAWLGTSALTWVFFFGGEVWRAPESPLAALFAAASLAGGVLAANSGSELIAGRFTPLGRRVEPYGAWVRQGLTAGIFFFWMALPASLVGILAKGAWKEIAAASVLAALCGGGSFEVGREDYRKKWIEAHASTDSKPSLPSRAP